MKRAALCNGIVNVIADYCSMMHADDKQNNLHSDEESRVCIVYEFSKSRKH
jgi:hypothetical protein